MFVIGGTQSLGCINSLRYRYLQQPGLGSHNYILMYKGCNPYDQPFFGVVNPPGMRQSPLYVATPGWQKFVRKFRIEP